MAKRFMIWWYAANGSRVGGSSPTLEEAVEFAHAAKAWDSIRAEIKQGNRILRRIDLIAEPIKITDPTAYVTDRGNRVGRREAR